jgi:hypothetical protein
MAVVGQIVTVVDDELGPVRGLVVDFNHEGYPIAVFSDGGPRVLVFPDMIQETTYGHFSVEDAG